MWVQARRTQINRDGGDEKCTIASAQARRISQVPSWEASVDGLQLKPRGISRRAKTALAASGTYDVIGSIVPSAHLPASQASTRSTRLTTVSSHSLLQSQTKHTYTNNT